MMEAQGMEKMKGADAPQANAGKSFRAGDHLFLVDASGYLYRAFHALPPLTRASDGMPVGALAGFAAMLHKLLGGIEKGKDNLTHIAIVFDSKGPTFRDDLYPAYKANRAAMPEELRPQMALARKAAAAFGLAAVEQQGVEADDLIATYAVLAAKGGAKVSIVSSDKDLMQLVSPTVQMVDSMKDKIIGTAEVEEKFGLPPEFVVDIQALAGDSTDNIPGAPGIGIKTAALLLREFGSLDALLERAGEIPQPKRRAALVDNIAQIKLSRDLVRLKQDCPLPLPPDALRFSPPVPEKLLGFLQQMEFRTLTRRIAKSLGESLGQGIELPLAGGDNKPAKAGDGLESLPGTSLAQAAERAAEGMGAPAYQTPPPILADDAALARWCEQVEANGQLGMVFVGEEETIGLGLAAGAGMAAYLPLNSNGKALVQTHLMPLLQNPCITKYGFDSKHLLQQLARCVSEPVQVKPLEDIQLLSYAFRPTGEGRNLESLALRHLELTLPNLESFSEGKRGASASLAELEREQAALYAGQRADSLLRLAGILTPMLALAGKSSIYHRLDLPLTRTLVRMEARGILLDKKLLEKLGEDFAKKMAAFEAEIYQEAGEKFNLASPKQIADILFGKLGMRGSRKTRTGQWSTRADFLEELAAGGEKLPEKILAWRHLAKLKSTYADALLTCIRPKTGRVHTRYASSATSTGRLASSDPNLQNIPIRTEEGRQIRRAFIAEKSKRLVSADYSQIELRVLACLANAASLQRAFADGQDIHAATASEIFSLPLEKVDAQARRRAKAINFGLIYGQTRYGLAAALKISHEEAQAYMDAYYARFPEVPAFMEATIADWRKRGYVETLFGRRCHFPARGGGHKGHLERAAINAPVQGTAADLMRRAMNRMEQALKQAGVDAAMLLQIHDELIFEMAEEEVARATPIIRRVMEEAASPDITLPVALKVDINSGTNWDDAH